MRALVLAALLLAFSVVGLGAYVRLADAGLGCPDWPGCYGQMLGVPEHAPDVFPGRPVDPGKAWKEMIHRYLAGTLGLLILALCAVAWRDFLAGRPAAGSRLRNPVRPPGLETALLAVVGVQAALGMWTVTLLLKPAIVTAHLLGGMATWALLLVLALRPMPGQDPHRQLDAPPSLGRWANLALLAVFAQIALGGWVSSNYAGLACPDLPACRGQWRPDADFAHGFTIFRALGETASGALLPVEALVAIHWTHRLGAVVVLLVVGGLATRLLRHPDLAAAGRWLFGLVALQLAIGIANVLWQMPILLALAHNLGAALLLAAIVATSVKLNRTG